MVKYDTEIETSSQAILDVKHLNAICEKDAHSILCTELMPELESFTNEITTQKSENLKI